MGRTIPSFTFALIEEESEWKSFRKYLDKPLRRVLDRLFTIPKLYISSCMCSANPIVMDAVFMSILFDHQQQLAGLVSRVEKLSSKI